MPTEEQGVLFINEEGPIVAVPPQPQSPRGCLRVAPSNYVLLFVQPGETEKKVFCLGRLSLYQWTIIPLSQTATEIDVHTLYTREKSAGSLNHKHQLTSQSRVDVHPLIMR